MEKLHDDPSSGEGLTTGHRTREQKVFLVRCHAYGLSGREIQQLFFERFGIRLTCKQVTYYDAGKLYHRIPRPGKKGSQLHRLLIEEYDRTREAWEKERLRLDPRCRAEGRVIEKLRRHDLLKTLIQERAARATDLAESQAAGDGEEDVPIKVLGEELTGLTAREWKNGALAISFDRAVLRELSELENEIAEELGQRVERKDLTSAGKPLSNVIVYLPDNGRDREPEAGDPTTTGAADCVSG